MNPKNPQEATTATPISHRLAANRITTLILSLSGGQAAAAITLPVAIHEFGHHYMPLAVAVGIAPAVPGLLACVVTATWTMAVLVYMLVTLGRIVRGSSGDSPRARAAEDLLRQVINTPIALLTLKQLPAASPDSSRAALNSSADVSPLPAVPGATSKAREAFYFRLAKEMKFEADAAAAAEAAALAAAEAAAVAEAAALAEIEADAAETAPPEVPVSRGRHARPEPEPEAEPDVAEDEAPPELDAAA